MSFRRTILVASGLAAIVAAPAIASFSGGSKSDTPAPSSSSTSTPQGTSASSARQDAERWYGDAYDEIAKAKKEVADGKTKNVEKRYKKALERGRRACEIDSTYHEAWNLVGYSSRKLGNYDDALAAYDRCLKLKPDYAPAREYLGEAYVELGKLDQAREQLAALDRLNAAEDAKTLRTAIDLWAAAHPESAPPATTTTAESAPADTSGTPSGR